MKFSLGFLFVALATAVTAEEKLPQKPQNPYTVAIYYWPNFHRDPFHQSKKGEGWTEWELVKAAKPKFPGHYQPKEPLWGYRDESDPKEMARSIDAMADAGIGAIIFDWYRYEDGLTDNKMIEGALEKGFLGATNRDRIKFALMWANHNYIDCHPFAPGKNFSNAELWRKGPVSKQAFVRITDEAIKRYFSQPNYWKIDGKPYFSIYEVARLIEGLGGVEATREALKEFCDRVKAAGYPGLHLNIVDWRVDSSLKDMADLGADSSTMYTWVHRVSPTPGKQKDKSRPASGKGGHGPLTDAVLGAAAKSSLVAVNYEDWGNRAMDYIEHTRRDPRLMYFPHVAVGWDGSPRNYGGGMVVNGTPELFGEFLARTKAWLDQHPECKGIMTINSWNEWVEGSYIEPDKKHGTAYLDQIRRVFGQCPTTKQ